MIHMVTCENRHLYEAELLEMHQLRRVHFIEERGWSALTVRADGGEYDACDDERTIYFLALDGDGHVGVSMRARPTDDKCILASVFPHLIEPSAGPVQGKDIWEISRIFATRKNRTRAGLRRRDEVFFAAVEGAVGVGVRRLVGMIDTYLLSQAQRFPWDLRPLGLPAAYPEGEVIGVGIPTSQEELAQLQAATGIAGSIIVPVPGGPTRLTPQELERLLAAAHLPATDVTLVGHLIERIAAVQDQTSEEALLALIDQVGAQGRGAALLH